MSPLIKSLLNLLAAAAVSVALLFGAERLTDGLIKAQNTREVRAAFGDILPADTYEELDASLSADILTAYRALDGEGVVLGYAVTAMVKGYGGEMQVHVALSPDGDRFRGLRVGENHETENLGSKVALPDFTSQFDSLAAPAYLDGYTGLERTSPPSESIDAVAGATVSSKAVVRAANAAYAFIRDHAPGMI